MDSLTAANTKFAVLLYKKLKEGKGNENIFVSPFSISTALAMVYLGAKGNTADEMAKVLHFDTNGDVHPKFKELMAGINDRDKPYLLKLANRLFGEETYTFLKTFQNSASKFYETQLAAVSFQSQPEAARKEINSWVDNRTEGKIQNILPEGSITQATKLVLVNAIYFKGQWSSKFNKNKTYVKSFWLNKRESKPINMMFQEGKFNFGYIEELQTKVLELPYVQNELSMIILLPNGINDNSTGLEQLEQTLTHENLLLWTNQANMMKIKVRVHLPRFKLEDQFDLKDVLLAMGMTEAFDMVKANFTGMSETSNLLLSNVFHKSFVEVNEEGTEAAAATAASIVNRSLPLVEEFVVDHPFLFFIKHNKTESILFFGCFSLPGDEVRGYEGAQQMMQQVQRCK
ncbi:leukocyte elastase inhibitor-like [Hemiscyllium ocellatum]|uniref:leukocyte elastase inhibitor-like n=1 Tax=Hemiscyllium ocellatum TaxID=170820 RepID=UPI00296764E7|nr:leukocyte elastase inhibitor-like [Hemiscyllium ocellatum]XP_060681305.1 leukocyte elastase inhibitor-like [Hemiscyllium ocellatum]